METNNHQTTAATVVILDETALKNLLESKLKELKEDIRELIDGIGRDKENDLITSNELCELLQTTKPQLWKWTQKGLLNPIRMTAKGKLYFRKSEVLESLKDTRPGKKYMQKRGQN